MSPAQPILSTMPRVEIGRLVAQIEELAAINRQADGSCARIALSNADRQGRELLVRWMKDAGLSVSIDPIGNVIGVSAGKAAVPPLMIGSHIDTVATGGRYDGAYGVLAGLEVVRAFRDAGVIPDRPIAVAAFTNEEGVRYQPDMMGSMVFAGSLSLEEAYATRGTDGSILKDELERIGFVGAAPLGEPRPAAYLELHIEQGPILDRTGGTLGAVADLQGISWQRVTVRGQSNHAGTTPMEMRRDAALTAARVIVFVEALCGQLGRGQVATVGQITLTPNLVNVVPGSACFTVDLRNADEATLARSEAALVDFLEQACRADGTEFEIQSLVRTSPVRFDQRIVEAIEQAAGELGHDIIRMTSGAGHDAQMMATICPSAMIFVPSIDGLSHNPAELTDPKHLEAGCETLLRVVMQLSAII